MAIEIRLAADGDTAAMAAIRAQVWQTAEFWEDRIGRYLSGEHSPQHALPRRAMFVLIAHGELAGFVAGHLTRRYACDAELQWIDVAAAHRGSGFAGALLRTMAAWFIAQKALRVCVNVDPGNVAARTLYLKYGAQPLNEQWLVWDDARTIAPLPGDAR